MIINATRFLSELHRQWRLVVYIVKQYFGLSKKSFVLFKIHLAAQRLIAVLLLARPPHDPKSSLPSLLKQRFCCETCDRGQFVASPTQVIFAQILASKVMCDLNLIALISLNMPFA